MSAVAEAALGFVDPPDYLAEEWAEVPELAEDDGDAVTLRITEPLEHQAAIDAAPQRHKAARCGRRWGKTRFLFKAAIVGHGPEVTERVVYAGRGPDGQARYRTVRLAEPEPLWRGIAHGLDVAWVVPTYKTANAIWNEEVEPRFRPLEKAGVATINVSEKWVQIENGGRLFIVSAENVHAVRGIGAKLGGVICDEAAWFDLEDAHKNVFMPALTDNMGWTLYASTTNGGLDGNAEKVAPSFFNRLCLEIQQGIRPAGPMGWAEFTGTAHDNPTLDPLAIDALVAEYVAGSVSLEQEVYAKLVTGGAGLAFPEWRKELHVRAMEPDEGWKGMGCLDWGWSSPGWFGVLYKGPGRRVLVRRELYFNGPPRPDWPRKLPAGEVGQAIGNLILHRIKRRYWPEGIAADSAMWGVTDGGPNVATKVQEGIDAAFAAAGHRHAPQLFPAPKGPGSRVARKLLVHELLAWGADAAGQPLIEAMPALTVHPDCAHLARTLPALPADLKNPEDVDTDAEDHPYDGFAYGLIATLPDFEEPAHDRETREMRGRLDDTSLSEADAFDRVLSGLRRQGVAVD